MYALVQFLVDKVMAIVPVKYIKNFDCSSDCLESFSRAYEVFWNLANGEGTGFWHAVVLLVADTEEEIEQQKKQVKLPSLKRLDELLASTIKHETNKNMDDKETRENNMGLQEKQSACEDRLNNIVRCKTLNKRKRSESQSDEDQRRVSEGSTNRGAKIHYSMILTSSDSSDDELVLKSELKRMGAKYRKALGKLKLKEEEILELRKKNNQLQELNVSLQSQFLSLLNAKDNMGLKPPESSTNEFPPKVSRKLFQETQAEISREMPAELLEETPEHLQETLAELSKEIPAGLPKETPTELPKEIPAELPKETPAELPKEILTELPKETPAELPKETPAELPKETLVVLPRKPPEVLPKETLEVLPKETPAKLCKETPAKLSKKETPAELRQETSANTLFLHDQMKWKDEQMELAPGVFIKKDEWERIVTGRNLNESRIARRLAESLWGAETLMERSITGSACKRYRKEGIAAKPALTPVKVDAVQNGIRFWLKDYQKMTTQDALNLSSVVKVKKILGNKIMDICKRQKIKLTKN